MQKLQLLIALISCFITSPVWSQPQGVGFFGLEKKVVKLDLLSSIPEDGFPFDRYFYIRRYIKDGTRPIKAVYITEPIPSFNRYSKNIRLPPAQRIDEIDFWLVDSDIAKDQPDYSKMVDILVPPLKPRKSYDLIFDYVMSLERREQLADALIARHNGDSVAVSKALNNVNTEKAKNSDSNRLNPLNFDAYYRLNARSFFATMSFSPGDPVTPEVRNALVKSLENGGEPLLMAPNRAILLFLDTETLSMTGTESFKLETRAEAVVQPDFGAVFYGFGATGDIGLNKDFMGVMPYVGFTIMLRSFDADIPIRFIKPLYPWQRLSFHAGVTLLTLAKDNYRDNLFGGQNLMLGVGYRLSSGLKMQGGVILYKKRTNPSPLNTDSMTAPIGYLGLSLDLRLRKILGDVGKFFTAN